MAMKKYVDTIDYLFVYTCNRPVFYNGYVSLRISNGNEVASKHLFLPSDRLSVHQIRRVHLDQCSVKSFHSWRRCQSTFSQAFPKVSNPDCPYDSPTNHSSFDTLPRAPVIHHVQVVESADIVPV